MVEELKTIRRILFGIQMMLFCIILLLVMGCKSVKSADDPLTTYWQMKIDNKKIKHQKVYDIDREINRLKNSDWRNQVHGIYSNIQFIRNKNIEPMKTFNEDDI